MLLGKVEELGNGRGIGLLIVNKIRVLVWLLFFCEVRVLRVVLKDVSNCFVVGVIWYEFILR